MKNEKNSTAVKKSLPKWAYILIAVAAILVIDVILFVALRNRDTEDAAADSVSSQISAVSSAEAEAETETEAAENLIQGVEAAQTGEELSIKLTHGMEITQIGAYTGAYVEDGTDEVVSGVMMLVVTNTGTDYIQYGEINVTGGESVYSFSLSTLMPGETVVLLEQSRMEYAEHSDYTAEAVNVAVFDEAPALHEDKIQIQTLEGALNITNISGEAISGDVVIYYKNYAGGMYYGGITYRIRIEGGMAADEIRQVMTEHFSASGSKIAFVTVG